LRPFDDVVVGQNVTLIVVDHPRANARGHDERLSELTRLHLLLIGDLDHRWLDLLDHRSHRRQQVAWDCSAASDGHGRSAPDGGHWRSSYWTQRGGG
jgi:hypothetical protein